MNAAKKNTNTMIINIGPQHPSMHGTLRLIVELDGESVVNIEQEIGYLHTGFEKIGEYRSYNQFVPISDRMNYLSPLSNNIGYAVAVEQLMGIEVPPRAQFIRTILAELSRFADHVISVGLQAMDLGAFSVMLWTFIEREKCYDIFEAVTGARFTTSYTRIGGLMRDVKSDFIPHVKSLLDKFKGIVEEIEYMLSRNRIFLDRTKGIGILSKDDAINYGVTGPILRASGIQWDVRRACPYLIYDDLDFEIPVENDGDVYARYRIRIEEMRQSIRIIKQSIDKLPTGPVNYPDHRITLPEKEEVYNTVEGLLKHFKLIMDGHGLRPPKKSFYSATEVPNGELGFFIESDGTGNPYRIHVRSPSLVNYQIFPLLAKGHMLSDLIAIMSSLNIIAGELDR